MRVSRFLMKAIRRFVPAVLLGGGLFLAGCELYDPRPQIRDAVNQIGAPQVKDATSPIRDEHYASWPKEIQEAVDNRQVLRGMDKLQAQAAMHLTEARIRKWEFQTAQGPGEKWLVYRTLNGWSSVRVPNSIEMVFILVDGVIVDMYR